MTTANRLANWASTNLSSGLAQRGYDIVLNIGQSNNVNGQGLDATLDYPMDVIKQLGRLDGYDYKIIQAVEPLHAHTRTTGSKGYVLDFSREYVREGNLLGSREVCIVPGAWGGTGFGGNRWNPGDDLCDDAVDRVNYIINNNEGSRLVAILWHQGESDVGNTEAWYADRLDTMITYMRDSIKGDNSTVPFICGGMVPYWVDEAANRQIIEDALIALPSRLAYTGFSDPRKPTLLEKPVPTYDSIHYSAEQHREFGKRYYKSWVAAKLNTGSNKIPATPQNLAVSEEDTYVAVSWDKPTGIDQGVHSYEIEYRPYGGVFQPHATVAGTVFGAKISGLTNGLKYHFRVRAINSWAKSEYSMQITGLPNPHVAISSDADLEVWLTGEGLSIADSSNSANTSSTTKSLTTTGMSVLNDPQRGGVIESSSDTGAYVNTTYSPPIAGYTKMGWFKVPATVTSSAGNLISSTSGGTLNVFWLANTSGDNLTISIGHTGAEYTAANGYVLSNSNVSSDQWFHAAVTHNSVTSTFDLYINGVLSFSKASSVTTGTLSPVSFLSYSSTSSRAGLRGDDMRVYSSVIGESEIREIMGEGTLPEIVTGENLIHRHVVLDNYFANNAEARSYNCFSENPSQEDKYSIIDRMERYRRSDGKFRFKMTYPDYNGGDNAVVWEQTANPLLTTAAEATTTAPGFSLISSDIGNLGDTIGALSLSGSASAYLDAFVSTTGNDTTSWYLPIGQMAAFTGGIPVVAGATDGTNVMGVVELYAVMD